MQCNKWTPPPKLRDREPAQTIPVQPLRRGTYTSSTNTMTIDKHPSDRSAAFRNLARGEDCTGKLYGGYCHCDPSTTVLAHTNTLRDNKGMGYKGHDAAGMFLGFDCHSWLDQGKATAAEKAVFVGRAQAGTRDRLAQIAADPMAKPWRRNAARWALDQLEKGNTQ